MVSNGKPVTRLEQIDPDSFADPELKTIFEKIRSPNDNTRHTGIASLIEKIENNPELLKQNFEFDGVANELGMKPSAPLSFFVLKHVVENAGSENSNRLMAVIYNAAKSDAEKAGLQSVHAQLLIQAIGGEDFTASQFPRAADALLAPEPKDDKKFQARCDQLVDLMQNNKDLFVDAKEKPTALGEKIIALAKQDPQFKEALVKAKLLKIEEPQAKKKRIMGNRKDEVVEPKYSLTITRPQGTETASAPAPTVDVQ